VLPIDPDRVYVPGHSATSRWAWQLAYDRPDLIAGVVGMAAGMTPVVRERFDSAPEVTTVIVRGGRDAWFAPLTRLRHHELATGEQVNASNPNSRWVLLENETHSSILAYLPDYCDYIMQFRRGGKRITDAERQAG
jgi:poly(3-hydroxybutyrate) depolymerase